ncbi:MAG TPA: invasin domain 3-containing protein, partial [Gemmatimonadaceae bacterium]
MRSRLLPLCVALLLACRGHEPTAPALTIVSLGVVPPTAAGATVSDSIRVRVADVDGNVKGGVSVAFAVTAGGGAVSPGVVTTDAQGRAAARFTTGTTVGVNTVTATIAGAAPTTITLTTVAGPAATIALRERIVFIDAGQRFTPTVTAADANGNTVQPSQLLYEARTPFVVSVASDGSVSASVRAQTILVVSSPLA